MALIYCKFLHWSIWPCLEAFFFFFFFFFQLVGLQLNSIMFHAFAKADMTTVVFIVRCLLSSVCLLKKCYFSKCDLCDSLKELLFKYEEIFSHFFCCYVSAHGNYLRQGRLHVFFPLFILTVFETSSVVAEKLQLSYTSMVLILLSKHKFN